MRVWLAAVAGLMVLVSAGPAVAQKDIRDADADLFAADVEYDPVVPTPEEFLGFKLGHEPVRHHQLVDYITRVAGMSDRLSLEVIGYTHERRPILFLVATSPSNHARLDEIRDRHAALSEAGGNQAVTDDMPIVTWLNYGVHGAESSGMDASLAALCLTGLVAAVVVLAERPVWTPRDLIGPAAWATLRTGAAFGIR